MKLLKKMYYVIMFFILILMYNNYYIVIYKKLFRKKFINLIIMFMNLFKICDIGFVKFCVDFVYIKVILFLYNIFLIE